MFYFLAVHIGFDALFYNRLLLHNKQFRTACSLIFVMKIVQKIQ